MFCFVLFLFLNNNEKSALTNKITKNIYLEIKCLFDFFTVYQEGSNFVPGVVIFLLESVTLLPC